MVLLQRGVCMILCYEASHTTLAFISEALEIIIELKMHRIYDIPLPI